MRAPDGVQQIGEYGESRTHDCSRDRRYARAFRRATLRAGRAEGAVRLALCRRPGSSPAARPHHTWLPNQPADAVVYPESTEEVVEIVNLCRASRTPIIPFGAGSSLEGHLNAPFGGVSSISPHEARARRQRRGSRRRSRAGRDAQGAEQSSAQYRAVLPRRSRRGCHAGRHGGNTRIGHTMPCATAPCGKAC